MDDKLRELIEARKVSDAAFRAAKDSYRKGEISEEEYQLASIEKRRGEVAVERYIRPPLGG